jgi:hypothetical protein
MGRPSILPGRRALAVIFLVVAAWVVVAIWRACLALDSAAKNVHLEHELRFVVRPLPSASNLGFEPINSPQVFFQAAKFHDHLYIASPAGLLEYDLTGRLIQDYAGGRELPGSPLVALTTAMPADAREPELIVATADQGLLAFNGQHFRQIFPYDAGVRAITAILSTPSGHLVIGTKRQGVLLYDGKHLKQLHSSLANRYVTNLLGDESDLWVGTLDRGVLHYHAGATDDFGEGQGLPDPEVMALAMVNQTVYVGTPLGVAVLDDGKLSHVLAPGIFATALLPTREWLYVGSEDQGVLRIPLRTSRARLDVSSGVELREVKQLFSSGDSVFAVAHGGLYRLQPHELGWRQVLDPGTAVLTDRNVSALALDANRHLWVGYFDRGIDVLASENLRIIHVEDEHAFCINRILAEAKTGDIDVATANGLLRFDSLGHLRQVLTRADGLIADHVTDVVGYGNGLALATPAGLTFLDPTGARSMYAFHGLVNNHIYALAVAGDQLMAGTLGGMSVLEKGIVSINYTATTSNLRHNWITAVVPVDSEWMVGTYGAGVLGLDRSGNFHRFDTASGDLEINPNAMLVTPRFVLAGSLGRGLYLYDRNSRRWSVIDQGLPSLNVTALAAGNGYLYVGTDNGLVRIPEQRLHL